MAAIAEWRALPPEVRDVFPLPQYCAQRRDIARFKGDRGYRPPQQQQNYDLNRATGKITLTTYNGSGDTSARAWVHKLDIYLSLWLMPKREAIQFAVLHLEGSAYDWWHHGLVTQDHTLVLSYAEFTERLITRFDRKDTELYYRELAHLRQTRHAKAYINEFQRIAVMVPDMTQKRSVMLFIEGLQDRLKGWVRGFQPATLKDAIDVTFRLDTTPTSYQTDKKPSGNIQAPQRPPL